LVNLYEILGLENFASPEDIKRAHRLLAKKYHPDLNSGNTIAEEKFKEVQNAYEILGDIENKEWYDFSLRQSQNIHTHQQTSANNQQEYYDSYTGKTYQPQTTQEKEIKFRPVGIVLILAIGFIRLFNSDLLAPKKHIPESISTYFQGDSFYTRNGQKYPLEINEDGTYSMDPLNMNNSRAIPELRSTMDMYQDVPIAGVRVGMNKSQLKEIKGDPIDVQKFEDLNMEIWTYKNCTLKFSGQYVTEIHQDN